MSSSAMMLRESGTEINRWDVARAKPCRVSLFGDPRDRYDTSSQKILNFSKLLAR